MLKRLPKALLGATEAFDVEVDGDVRTVTYSGSTSVIEVLWKNGIDISDSCGGSGTCGTCRIRVVSSNEPLEARNEVEAEMANDRGFTEDERLACQISPCPGLRIRVP